MAKNRKQVEVPAKQSYNYEDDVFYARPVNRAYSSSIDVGEFIFDINDKGEVVGLEILNASKVFHVPKEALRNIISMKLEIAVSEETVQIVAKIKSVIRNGQRSSSLLVDKTVPELMQPSHLQMALA